MILAKKGAGAVEEGGGEGEGGITGGGARGEDKRCMRKQEIAVGN